MRQHGVVKHFLPQLLLQLPHLLLVPLPLLLQLLLLRISMLLLQLLLQLRHLLLVLLLLLVQLCLKLLLHQCRLLSNQRPLPHLFHVFFGILFFSAGLAFVMLVPPALPVVLVCLVLVSAAAVGGRAGTTAAILENQMGSSPPATSCHRPWQEVGPPQVVAAWRVLKLPGLVVQLVLVTRVRRQLWLLLLPWT